MLCSHFMTPPNATKATELKAILDRVDVEACDINDQIEAMLFPVQEYAKLKKEEVIKNQEEVMQKQKGRQQQLAEAKKLKYKTGLVEITSSALTGENISKDSFGFRWLICSVCGQIKREDEMASYCGKVGICGECSR